MGYFAETWLISSVRSSGSNVATGMYVATEYRNIVIPAWEAIKLTQVTSGYTKSQFFAQKWGIPSVDVINCFQMMQRNK
jgi:hypothetical protein